MGYLEKNRQDGSHEDFTLNHYGCVWVISGTGLYQDEEHGEIRIKKGDFIQRLPGVTHSTIITSDDWKELYIDIGLDLYRLLCEMQVISRKSPILRPGMDFKLLDAFFQFYDQLRVAKQYELPLLMHNVVEIVARLHHLDKIHNVTSDESIVLEISKKYIMDHIHERPTGKEIAAHVNLGYEKFRKLFASYYGVSPGYYMQQQRNYKAQSLLTENERTVAEISELLGYIDTPTFSKQFKKATGLTPSKYRKLYY